MAVFRIPDSVRHFIQDRPGLHNFLLKARRVCLILFVAHLLYIILLRWVPVYTTPLIISRWFDRIGTDKNIYKDWVSSDQISDQMKMAVIASEDQLFNEHFGFDIEAIEKAIKHNQKHPKRIRGASTISQQVAKNVFLWSGRSYFRKALEIYFTFMIELVWGKERILEVYLNVAETGDGIFGVEAASQIYFHHSAKTLTASESALIAAVLPNPIRFKVKAPSPFVLKRQRWILHQMQY